MFLRLLQKHLAHKLLPDYFYFSFHVVQLISAETITPFIDELISRKWICVVGLFYIIMNSLGLDCWWDSLNTSARTFGDRTAIFHVF